MLFGLLGRKEVSDKEWDTLVDGVTTKTKDMLDEMVDMFDQNLKHTSDESKNL
jgi:hypothetical protein